MDCVFLLAAHRTTGRGDEVIAPSYGLLDRTGKPPVVDLATWPAARDELLVRENAHTHEGEWSTSTCGTTARRTRGSARAAPPRPVAVAGGSTERDEVGALTLLGSS